MADYIDKEQLKYSVKQYFKHLIDKGKYKIDVLDANADIHKIISELPAIERLPDANVVALPVKYGQTLWRIDGNGFRSPEFQKAVPVTVQEIVFKDVRGKPQWSFIASSTMFSFGGIGKTVFLTKEEAEKVIAKRRANNG